MARATRSATQHHEKDKNQFTHRSKQLTKKRKRVSLQDDDQHPPSKQHRTDNHDNPIKEESTDSHLYKGKLPDILHVADVPLLPLIAHKVLEILEIVDSQGLLDRVFPLGSTNPSEPSTSKSQMGTYSLRTLLKESTQHPLRVLRSAVQNLFPMTYHHRSRTSSPAAQQLRFCDLAQSLLDQASFHSVQLPLDIESIIPLISDTSAANSDSNSPLTSTLFDKLSHTGQGKRYALMQRIPSATWWSSLTSDIFPDSKDFKDLQTANAELVAILPSPSSLPYSEASLKPTIDTHSPITLGAYVPKKPPGHRSKLPGPRHVSCGSFLDYGPYATFAPSFDQEGVEVGREALGEVLCRWEHRKKAWAADNSSPARVAAQRLPMEDWHQTEGDQGRAEAEQSTVIDPSLQETHNDDDEILEGLLSKEQVASLKSALMSLKLENDVQELLDRNARALTRLEELQTRRLMKEGGFHPVQEGSEEWDTAQGILESLTLLASLRPRQLGSQDIPLIPSATALRKLHRTLPVAPSQGWYGTLPTGRTTALRDDSTLYIKSTATTVPSQAPVVPTPTPAIPAATPAATTSAAAQNYSQYSYNYATGYRGAYQYKPGQAGSYYPPSYGTQGQTQTTTQYYANQQYAASGQQQYSYSSWYQYQPQTQPGATNTTVGQGLSQTGATATPPATIPTSYAGFFNNTAQSGQRAVANTVTAKPHQPAAGTTWGTGTAGYVPPTLPPHMRTTAVGGTAQQGAYPYQPNYYGAYQAQAAASPAQ